MRIKLSLLPLALGGLTIGITEFVMMGMLPDMAADLKVSIPKAGHLISAYAMGVVVGAPLLVILGRNMPPRKMLIMLSAMLAIFNSFSIFAPGFDLLLASRFLSGLPHGAFFGLGAVIASRLADKGRESQSVAVMFSGLTIANVVGVPLGTYIGHHYNWRYTFILIAIIGLLAVCSMFVFMPHMKKQETASIKKQLGFFARRDAWLILVITSIGFGGFFCWISYIAPLLTKVSKFEPEQVPYIMMLAGVGMVTGNILGGRIADKFRPSHSVLVMLLVMAATLTAVYTLSAYATLSLILVFFTGCVAFAVVAPVQMLVIQTARGAETIASATIQACFNIGNALGAYLGGLPLLWGFNFTSPNLVGVGMALMGAAATAILIKVAAPAAPLTEEEQATVVH